MTEVLPFTYSSTNWIGDVVGVSAASVARVALVQLTGDDDDVTTWTEVPGTASVLVNDVVGEGEKVARWNPKDGVWKATFDILNGNSSIHQETAFFDLRSLAKGMLIIFK